MINYDDIMVSISCTTYNHERYVRKCLEGFVMQKTNFKFEVLVHDDASTDSTPQIIKEFEEKYPDIIKPIYQKENQFSKGVKIAKNYQLPRMKGKYVAFCEGDDYWSDPLKLQKQFDILEENKNCSICVHKVLCIKENGDPRKDFQPNVKIFPYETGMFSQGNLLKLLQKQYLFQTSSYFIRKNIYEEYYNNLPEFAKAIGVGDAPLFYYFISKGDCFYINKDMSCYRTGSLNSWTSKQRLDLSRRLKHIEQLIAMLNLYNEYNDYKFDEIIKDHINRLEFETNIQKKNYKECVKKENRKELLKYSFRIRVSLYLNAYFPFFMKLYGKFKNKLRQLRPLE